MCKIFVTPHKFCAALGLVSPDPGPKNTETASVSDLSHNRRTFVPNILSPALLAGLKKNLTFLMEIVVFSK